MLKRHLETELNDWIENGKTALLVSGARQVGKTYLIRSCLKQKGADYIEINCIRNPELISVFQKSKNSRDLKICER